MMLYPFSSSSTFNAGVEHERQRIAGILLSRRDLLGHSPVAGNPFRRDEILLLLAAIQEAD